MSWKKYGGIHNVDRFNTLSVYSLAADKFTLREAIYGTFDISGELRISGETYLAGNTTMSGLIISGELATDSLYVANNAIHNGSVDISRNLTVRNGNINAKQNLNVDGYIKLNQGLILGNTMNAYMISNPLTGNIGINTSTPISSFDISGSQPFLLNVGSVSQETVYSVPVRNKNNRGISLNANTFTSQINFYNDASINPQAAPNGFIQYASGGFLTIDVSNNTNILSTVGISNRAASSHIMNETLVIYDVSSGTYLPQIYQNTTEKTGNALTLVANDSSSNTFMNIITPNKQGLSVGGGAYPNDQTRSMATVGLLDTSSNYTPTLNIVSGTSKIRKRTTIGFNTYAPIIDNYTFDVNGPMHLNNGELNIASQPNFEIIALSVGKNSPNYSVAIGSPYTIGPSSYKQKILYTSNGGETWLENYDLSGTQIETTNTYMRAVFVFDSSLAIISGDGTYTFYSYNGGIPIGSAKAWPSIVFPNYLQNANYGVKAIYINSSKRVFMGIDASGANSFIYWFDLPSNIYQVTGGFSTTGTGRYDGSFNLDAAGIKSMEGYISGSNTCIWVAYGSNIALVTINNGSPSTSQNLSLKRTGVSYRTIDVFSSSEIFAAGTNIVSTSTNGGSSWTDISLSSTTINKINMLDSSNGLAVGNGGKIIMTTNGGSSWTQIPTSILNTSGNANRLIDPSYNLISIGVVDSNNFYIVKPITSYAAGTTFGNTSLYHAYLPNLFNNTTNYVLDVSGSAQLSGDLNVNDGGEIASNNPVFNLLNNGVTQVNFASDASLVNIASKINGNVVVNCTLDVLQRLNVTGNTLLQSNLVVTGNTFMNGNLNVSRILTVTGNTLLQSNLVVTGNTFMNGNLNVGRILTVTGNTLLQSNLVVTGNTFMNGNLNVGDDMTVTGNALIQSNLVVTGNTFVNGNLNVGRILTVTGNTLLQSNLVVTGNTFMNGNLNVGRILTVTGNALLQSNLVVTGNTFMNGNLNVGDDMTVTGNALLQSNLVVTGNTFMNGNLNVGRILTVTGNTLLQSNLVVTGNTFMNGNLNVGDDMTVTGNALLQSNLVVTGNTFINGNLNVGRILTVTGNTLLQSNLVVTGNTFMNGNLNVGRILTVTGNTLLQSNLVVTGNTFMNGNLNVGDDMTVTGNALLQSNLVVTGNTFINGNLNVGRILTVTGNALLQSNLVVTGNTFMNGNLNVGNDMIVTGNVLLQSNLVVTGNTFINGNLNVGRILTVTGNALLQSNLVVTGNTFMNGNLNVGRILTVTGNTLLQSNLVVTGNTFMNGNLNVVGSGNIYGNLTLGSSFTGTYALNVIGDVKATSYNATSDRRLKSNINIMHSQIPQICKLSPVTFDWKKDGREDYGFIAQEVFDTYPKLRPSYQETDPKLSRPDSPVDSCGNPIYYTIDYGRMTPFLWQGMREVIQRIEVLESENRLLKQKVERLESLV